MGYPPHSPDSPDGVMPEHVTRSGESPRGDSLDCPAVDASRAIDKARSLFLVASTQARFSTEPPSPPSLRLFSGSSTAQAQAVLPSASHKAPGALPSRALEPRRGPRILLRARAASHETRWPSLGSIRRILAEP